MVISLRLRFPTMSTSRLLITLLIVLHFCCWTSEARFGRKKRLQAQREKEAARLANLVVIFGLEIPKMMFNLLTSLIAVGVAAYLLGPLRSLKPRGNRPDTDGTIDVVVVGCGLPKKGMGWFHLTQLLEMERVNVRAVVEPFYMNPELCPNPPPAWTELVSCLTELRVEVVASVSELTATTTATKKKKKKKKLMALIAGRTNDNPALFNDCVVTLQSDLVYLENPGAPTVAALEEMQALALKHRTEVYIGYNKNVTPYMQKMVALAEVTPHSHVFLCHNNSYSTGDLPEVFALNPEGMLKSMAIHELAVLVTYFNVTVDQIEKFKVNTSKLFSEKVSVWKPGTSLPKPEFVTDFSRCAFKITLTGGRNVSIMVDRCGGNVSFAVVKDEGGKEVERFEFPTPVELEAIEREVQADPFMMPYFFVQRGDYWELKQRVVNAALGIATGDTKDGNGSAAEGVATIQVGIEALKLAEYATEALNKALKAK